MEARDIHATNVVSGSQYIQQQTIYQAAAHPSVGEHSPDQQDRARLLKALGKAYREVLESSLQGVTSIRLTMREWLDLTEAEVPTSWQLPQKERLLPEGTALLDVYTDATTGLLILGAPGAGKSTLLYELAQALLKRAAQQENSPVPVVLNLSLWASKRLPLQDWIVEQLELRYYVPRKLGQRWQQDERWLLLLDGLDEVALTARAACVEAINTYLASRTRLVSPVVCSRLEDYQALREPLRLPSVVMVQPLTPEQIETYLRTAGSSLAAVREVVQRNPVLHELLTTPLMLHVVTLAYRDKAVTDLPQLGSAEVQQQHIFASYLQRMLPLEGKRSPPSASKTLHSLVWLARQMRARSQSLLYLEQLQPDWLPSGWTELLYRGLGVRLPDILIGGLGSIVVFLMFGYQLGIFGLLSSFLLGAVVAGLLGSLPAAHATVPTSHRCHRFLALLAQAALFGLVVGLFRALLSNASSSSLSPPLTGITFGVGTALLMLLLARWPSSSPQASSQPGSDIGTRAGFWRRVLSTDVLRKGLPVGSLLGLSEGLTVGLTVGLRTELSYGLIAGLIYGLGSGLVWGVCGVFISQLLVSRPTTIVPAEIVVWSWKRLWGRLKQREHSRKALLLAWVGPSYGLVRGLDVGQRFGLDVGLPFGLIYGLDVGLIVGGSYWLLFGLFQAVSSTTFREPQRTTPNRGTHRSGRNGLVLGSVAAIIAAVIGGVGGLVRFVLIEWPIVGLREGLRIGLLEGLRGGLSDGLSYGWQIGLAIGLLVTLLMGGLAWWRHWVLRFLLWRSGALPWRLVPLLDEAAQRILLRKVGGGYRFIHDLFRDYLATLDPAVPNGAVAQGAPHYEEAGPSGE